MMHQEGCEVVQICTELYPAVQMPSPCGVGPQCRMGAWKATAEDGLESFLAKFTCYGKPYVSSANNWEADIGVSAKFQCCAR